MSYVQLPLRFTRASQAGLGLAWPAIHKWPH
eukprot:CAMPEP_0175452032 /NCGR_PEP_ID=MMETSP0095-20121207/63202_1 /TAXON_ID=311494 /ORGANISM="Alexandrium monilatum, Strain CCMP3105" /LENGTH=30 /DNA_ID= /DNA_START= /DNA_END= /DNA_ORIENTATION=